MPGLNRTATAREQMSCFMDLCDAMGAVSRTAGVLSTALFCCIESL